MSRAASVRAARSSSPSRPAVPKGYFHRSELPLASLIFLLPFLVIYELGTRYLASPIVAFAWMQDLFHVFGVTGKHLPAFAVVAILFACHLMRQDPWQIKPAHLFGMLLESVCLSVPLLLLGMLASHYLPLMAMNKALPGLIVLSVGAGIYEELVFRLIAFALLSAVFIDLLKMQRGWANLLMVVISSLAFSLYHYLGYESFGMRSFAFRTAAGLYFGAVYAYRGFGISAGSHTSYDIIVTVIRACST